MATTQNTYTGDNLTVSYSFTFPYLEETDIKVSLDGVVTTAYSLSNATTITFDTAPGTGVAIRIYRDTNNDELAATFFAGSAIRAQDLNEDFLQSNYSVQEIKARYVDAQAPVIQGNIDMNGNRIIDMADPTSDQDAATKFYIDTRLGDIGIPGHTRWRKTATASQTTFSGTGDYGGTLAYTATREQVYLNGALQQRGVDYTADDGDEIVFSVALTAGDIVDIVCVNNLTNSDLVLISDANVDDNAGIVATKLSFTQSGTGATARTVDSKLKDIVSVKDFGAVGDGTTDDTAAIQAAIDYAQTQVQGRFKGGQIVYFPSGTYLITAGIIISEDPSVTGLNGENNIGLVGDGPAHSVIYAQNPDFDLISFLGRDSSDPSPRAFFGALVRNLRITCAGNATAGAALTLLRCITSQVSNLVIDGPYDGLVLDGCSTTYVSNFVVEEVSRSSGVGRYGLDLKATGNVCSDIHITDYQLRVDYDRVGSNYSTRIQGADGVYFENGHQWCGLDINPTNTGVTQSTSSVFFSNVYFDTAPEYNVYFRGGCDTAEKYGNIQFSNCFMRASRAGVKMDPNAVGLVDVKFNNCRINTHDGAGIDMLSNNVDRVLISNCSFKDNNGLGSAVNGDLIVDGQGHIISNCSFVNGDAAGKAVILQPTSSYCILANSSFQYSTAGTLVDNNGSANQLSSLTGFVLKKTGSATITPGNTSTTVSHGLSITPSNTQIQLTLRTNATGVTRFYTSNVTATTFDINTNAAPSVNAVFSWLVDASL